jgi:hypothetical protein
MNKNQTNALMKLIYYSYKKHYLQINDHEMK